MAYRFEKEDPSVAAGVRRIAAEQIERALAEIDDAELPRHEAVHQVRKRTKKVRGLIRLVRPAFAAYQAENAALRDAAAGLSQLRDAEVLISTFDDLVAAYEEPLDPVALAPVRETLEARQEEISRGHDLEASLGAFRSAMEGARARIETWRLNEDGFTAIQGGLEKTHRRARKAMARARAAPRDEGHADLFHDWRKRTKYHWYHTRLLRPIWPGPMQAHEKAADQLGDLLGDHHDLSVFRATILAEPEALADPPATNLLAALADQRQMALEAPAQAVGNRLFAEPTKVLRRRWQAYWQAWQAETD